MMDKIIITNNPKLRNKMYFMSLMLIRAMKRCDSTDSKEPMQQTMNDFRIRLHSKRFSVPSDSKVVYDLMKKLVSMYEDEWRAAQTNQKSMLKRSRDLLLEWGHFSRNYERRTGMKKQMTVTEVGQAWLRAMCLLFAPILGILLLCYAPYPTISLTQHFTHSRMTCTMMML